MKRTKRPSQREIADHFKVSVATVSRALNGNPNIKQELKESIFKFANEIGYGSHSNSVASGTFLAIVPLSSAITGITEFYTDVTREIEQTILNLGARIETKIVSTSFIDRIFIEKHLVNSNVDGLFVVGIDAGDDLREWCNNEDVSVVLVNGRDPHMRFSSVAPANFAGAHLMTNRIIEAGHKNVIYYTTSVRPTILDRIRGFEYAANGKISFEIVSVENANVDDVVAKVESEGVTCVFCFNDVLAVEILQMLSTRETANIGQPISVVGFDNLAIAGMTRPRLTTVNVDREAIGQQAVKVMQHELEGRVSRIHVEILVQVVAGESLLKV